MFFIKINGSDQDITCLINGKNAESSCEIEVKNSENSCNYNQIPKNSTFVIKNENKFCDLCLKSDGDESTFSVKLCKFHESSQRLEKVQGNNQSGRVLNLSTMKDKSTTKDSSLEEKTTNQVEDKIYNLFTDTEVVMSPNEVLSEIRYHILKKLLHKSAESLNFSVEMVLKIEAENLETSSVKLDFLKKNNILWNFLLVLKFLKPFSKNDYTLQYIKEIDQLTELLDKVKHDINFNSFTEYYKKIEGLLDRMGVFILEIQHLNPSSKVKCNKAELKMLGWSKEVYKIISACENFSQMIELSFGPTKMRENNKEIKDYIKKQMYDEFKHEQPEIKKMIHAAKKQQKKFDNGAKLTIILCAHMVKYIKFFLMRQLSPKQVKNGYNVILKEALRILDSLCFGIDAETLINSGKSLINRKFLAGGGATEIELYSNLESFVPNENKHREVDVRDGLLMGLTEVPKTLLENNGLCGLNIVVEIIQQHKKGRKHLGCDIEGNNVFIDAKDKGILDDYFTKRNAIKLAVNTACEIINDCDLQHKKNMVQRKN